MVPRLKGDGERSAASIAVEVHVTLNPGADPELVTDAIGDLLCSVGENEEARQVVDEHVASFDHWDWTGR